MYAEEDLLPISALQHLLFCPRQCALIHVERLWAENSLTLEGRHLHQKADAGRGEIMRRRSGAKRGPGAPGGAALFPVRLVSADQTGTAGSTTDGSSTTASDAAGVVFPPAARQPNRGRTARGLMLRSLALGLLGKADVVEFHAGHGGAVGVSTLLHLGAVDQSTASVASSAAPLIPFPVEYKRGKPKKDRCDEVQLCAQAFCLEEMLGVAVPAGAIFYGVTRRRIDVAFTDALRRLTLDLIRQLREMIDSGTTPSAAREKKCEKCSLIRLCLPEAHPGTDAASRYVKRAIAQSLTGEPKGE